MGQTQSGSSTSNYGCRGEQGLQGYLQGPPARTVTNRHDLSSPLTFHTVHGENIVLSNNNRISRRAESFCKGICFSNRPIAMGEKVLITFKEVSVNWSGVLRVGFTSVNPESVRHQTLPRYACPDLTNKTGHWAKALNERYADQNNVLFFYITREGVVMYGVNDVDKGSFFSGVNLTSPLWVMADIYGNTIAIEIQSGGSIHQPPAPQAISQGIDTPNDPIISRQSSTMSNQMPSSPRPADTRIICPAIRHHANAIFNPIPLSITYGRHITLLANRTIAARSSEDFCQGYVFTSRPMKCGEKIVIQVLATALNYFGGLCFGVTSCDPLSLSPADLPYDSDNLLDRGEYWVVNKDVCNDPSVGDELSFSLTHEGEIRYSRNCNRVTTLMHVDTSLPLWVFFDLYGNLQKLRVLGVISNSIGRQLSNISQSSDSAHLNQSQPSPRYANSASSSCVDPSFDGTNTGEQIIEVANEDTVTDRISECTVCYENRVDSVIYTCGHMCMCYKCAMLVKNSHDALCPICRHPIKDVIKIYKS